MKTFTVESLALQSGNSADRIRDPDTPKPEPDPLLEWEAKIRFRYVSDQIRVSSDNCLSGLELTPIFFIDLIVQTRT